MAPDAASTVPVIADGLVRGADALDPTLRMARAGGSEPVPAMRDAVEALGSVSVAPSASILGSVAQAFTAPMLVRDLGRLAPLEGPATRDLDQDPLRSWERNAQGQVMPVDFDAMCQSGAAAPEQHRFQEVSEPRLDAEIEAAEAQRSQWVDNLALAPANDRVVPKDGSMAISTFYMCVASHDDASVDYVRQMARLGRVEGFRVVAETDATGAETVRGTADELERGNLTLVPLPGNRDVWVEDHGEMTLGHRVSVPAFVGDEDFVDEAILVDRARRFHPEAELQGRSGEQLARAYPDIDFSKLGAVDQRRSQESMVALGVSEEVPVRENLTYIEGGNVLPGTLPDGSGYALVGRDSIAISRALLERDSGHAVSDDEVLEAVARDLGIDKAHVYPVEQPGEFHIDMRMAALAPGEVYLNDARAAARVQEKWLREDCPEPQPPPPGANWLQRSTWAVKHAWWKQVHGRLLESRIADVHAEAAARARYEDRTAADLARTGLVVHRVAGVFVDPSNPSEDRCNFLNCRSGVNPEGRRFMIALGGDSRAEQWFVRDLMERQSAGVDRVHFLDRRLTPLTLDLFGGIKCRTKTEGSLAPLPGRAD